MRIRTLSGALNLAKSVIKKYFGETVIETENLEKNASIIETKYSKFLLFFVEDVDRTFRSTFPEIAKQILWDEGVKIGKKTVIEFVNRPNPNHKKLSILIALGTKDLYQISPYSLINFCELTRLEVESQGVYYFFPTIFLKKIKGDISPKETKTKDKLYLISQINALDDYDLEDIERTASFKDFDVDVFGEIMRSFRTIEERLENIENLLRKIYHGRENN